MIKPSNQLFTDVFRLLSKRIARCGQAHVDGTPIDLKKATVTNWSSTNIPNYFRVDFHNNKYIPEVDQTVGDGEVNIIIHQSENGIPWIFSLCNRMNVTIVEFQPESDDQDYIKFKLQHA